MIRSTDLTTALISLRGDIDAALSRIFATGQFIGGPEVEGLEREFAALCRVGDAVAVGSGTDAIRFALMAAGVGGSAGADRQGARNLAPPRSGSFEPDEVITSPLSFIASTEAISQAGGRPVFADIDPATCTLDPRQVERAITPRTRAILPVHLYGQTADMDPILELAKRRGIAVVEDACQAHGAIDRGRVAGGIGDAGCFSFYPTKNLGGCGEGGMVTTSRPRIAARVRRLRDHGQVEKYRHSEEGYNGRLDAIQAAILRIKLRHLGEWNDSRRRIAARYRDGLRGVGVVLPVERPGAAHVYHQFTIRLRDRDRARSALRDRGIETGIHYPVPLHLQECYAWMGHREGSFPQAEAAAREVLSLPIYPELTDAQVEEVCAAVRAVAGPA
jgi:dTDP-4-amino-4,6-dideoxygalactose transaminase